MKNFVEVEWAPVARLPVTSIGVHSIRHCTCVEDVEGLIEERIHQEMRERTAAMIDHEALRTAALTLMSMREHDEARLDVIREASVILGVGAP